jgi:hypothetical protein
VADLTDGPLKKRNITKLVEQMNAIIDCIAIATEDALILHREGTVRRYFMTVIGLIGESEAMAPELSKIVMTSPVLMRALLTIWSFTGGDKDQVFHTWGENGLCLFLKLMDTFLKNPYGVESIRDSLLDSEAQLGAFAASINSRIAYLPRALINPNINPADVALAFVNLLNNTGALAETGTIHHALRKAGYLRSLTKAMGYFQSDNGPSESHKLVLYLLNTVFERATLPGGNPIKGIQDIVDADMMSSLIDALDGLVVRAQSRNDIMTIQKQVRTLGTYSHHPRCFAPLRLQWMRFLEGLLISFAGRK